MRTALRSCALLAISLLLTASAARAQSLLWGVSASTLSASGLVQGASLVPDNAGGTYVIWVDSGGFSTVVPGPNGTSGTVSIGGGLQCGNSGNPCYNMNIYAVHLNAAGALAAGWPTANAGAVLVTNAFDQSQYSVDNDGAGGFVVSWTTSSFGASEATFAQRYSASGAAQWSGPGDGAGGAGGAAAVSLPSLANGTLVVSGSASQGYFGYFAVNASSGLIIQDISIANGQAPAQALANDFVPLPQQLVGGGLYKSPDPSDPGVILLAHGQFEGGSAFDVMAWRFDSTGLDSGWAVTGSSVTTDGSVAVGNSFAPTTLIGFPAQDGTGAVYAVWYDTGASPGFHAAKVSGTTTPSLDNAGGFGHMIAQTIQPGTVAHIGHDPGRVAAADGEFAVTWSTNDGGFYDAYLQIVNSNWNEVLGSGGLDLGSAEQTVLAISSTPANAPLLWAVYIGTSPNFQAFTSTGGAVFSAPFMPTRSEAGSLQGPAGLGDSMGYAFVGTLGGCAGGNCHNLYIQDVSTAPPALLSPVLGTPSVLDANDIQIPWTDPNSPGASQFLIQAALDAGFTQIVYQIVLSSGALGGGPSYAYTLSGLTPGTNYFLRVQAQASGYPPAYSSSASAATRSGSGYVNASLGDWSNAAAAVNKQATVSGPGCAAGTGNNGACGQGTLLLPGPGGDAFMVWTADDGTGTAYNILAQRLNAASGAAVWGPVTLASHIPEGASEMLGSPHDLGGAADGAAGFVVSWTSGTENVQGYFTDVNGSNGAVRFAPALVTPSGAEVMASQVVVSGGAAFFVDVNSSGQILVQPMNAASGSPVGSGVATGVSLVSGVVLADTPSPANGSLAAGAIVVIGKSGAGAASTALRVNAGGGEDWGGTFPALANVSGDSLQAVPDASGGAYVVWTDTIDTQIDALHLSAAGAALSTAAVAGGWTATGSGLIMQAVETPAGPVAAWDAPAAASVSVDAALLNTGAGGALWSKTVATLSASNAPNAVSIASNTAGLVAVAYGFPSGTSGLNSLDAAELNAATGGTVLSAANALAGLPAPGGAPIGGAGALVVGSTADFIVAAAYAPDLFATNIADMANLLAPQGLSASSVSTSAITLSWTDPNTSPATSYLVEMSSAAAFTSVLSTTVPAASASFSGLNPNTTYYFMVQASSAGAQSPFSQTFATATVAAAPSAVVQVAQSSYSLTVQWNPDGDPVSTTRFRVAVALDPAFGTGVSTQTVYADSATFTGLSADTSYYVQVRAEGHDYQKSAFADSLGGTLPAPPAPLSPEFANVSTSFLTFGWVPPSAPAGAAPDYVYDYVVSTSANLTGPYVSSASALARFVPSLTVSGLSPNTSYYVGMQVEDLNGPVAQYSAFAVLGVTSTFAAAATNVTLTVVSSTSLSAQWAAADGPIAAFQAAISTNPDFSAPVATAAVTGSTDSWTFTGLSPSTTYYAQIALTGNNGDFLVSSSAYAQTLIAPPGPPLSGPVFTGVTPSSMTVNWFGGGNAGMAQFEVDIASYISGGNFGVLLASAATTNTSAVFGVGGVGSLSPNTTYYAQVRIASTGSGQQSGFVALGSTSTFAVPPSVFAVSSVTANTASFSWSADNGPNAHFRVELSTVADFSSAVTTSPILSALSYTFSGLSPSQLYFAQVRAKGNNGDLTAYSAEASTTTLLVSPVAAAPALVSVGTFSVTVQWGSGGNTGATYLVQAATDATFGAIAASTQTLALQATVGSLSANTTYYFEVQAQAASGQSAFLLLGGTATLAAVPGALSSVFVGVSSASIEWNPSFDPFPGTEFRFEYSTFPSLASAQTTLTYSSGAVVTGLSAGATYYFDVAAINRDGAQTPFTNSGFFIVTAPPAPSGFAATVLGISSIAWTWAATPGATSYSVSEASNTADVLASVDSPGFVETGLTPGVLAGIVVQAVDSGGLSPLSNPATAYTLAVAPSTPTETAANSVSIQVQWSANGDSSYTAYEVDYSSVSGQFNQTLAVAAGITTATLTGLQASTTYYVEVRAENGAGTFTADGGSAAAFTAASAPTGLFATALGISSISWSWNTVNSATSYEFYPSSGGASSAVSAPPYIETGLLPDVLYSGAVTAINAVGQSVQSSSASIYTLAAVPVGLSSTSATSSSVGLSWNADGNPAAAAYQVAYSSSVGVYSAHLAVAAGVTTATLSGLAGSTTYYVEVEADNGNGFFSLPSAPLAVETAPNPPTGLAGAALGVSSITWTWNAVAGAASYNFYFSTGGAPASVAAPALTQSGLSPNTRYGGTVTAVDADGESVQSSSATIFTLAAAPLNLQAVSVLVSSLTLTWSQNGNPAGTNYSVGYYAVAGGPASNAAAGTGSSFGVSGLNGGTTYVFTLSAINGNSIATVGASTQAVTSGVPSISSLIGPSGGLIVLSPPTGPISVNIPPGAFPSSVDVTLEAPSSFSAYPDVSPLFALVGTGIGVQILVSPAAEPDENVPLSISYDPSSLGSVNPQTLFIARWDPVENVWVPLVSSVNTSQHTVSAETEHFSLFQLMSNTAAATLSAPKVFPDPFRPAKGDTTITIANLPAFTTLRIYDILGERVRSLSTDASGMASWDGKNDRGENAASGVYFVLAGSGSSRKTFKLAIQR